MQVGGCLNKQPGMWKCRQADGLVGNSDDWVDRKAGDGAEDLGGWEARRQGHVRGWVMWAGKHGEGEGEGGRAILEGWAAGRQEVYPSVFLYLYIYIDTLYRHN